MRAPAGLAVLVAIIAAGCGQDAPGPPTASAPTPPAATATAPAASGAGDPAKGRQVYVSQCVACHNSDPARAGPVGPPVQGAPRDLLQGKVLEATYPPGYTPTRDSRVMPARPDLAPSIPDLAAYLGQAR